MFPGAEEGLTLLEQVQILGRPTKQEAEKIMHMGGKFCEPHIVEFFEFINSNPHTKDKKPISFEYLIGLGPRKFEMTTEQIS